jgi:hypothetical protein
MLCGVQLSTAAVLQAAGQLPQEHAYGGASGTGRALVHRRPFGPLSGPGARRSSVSSTSGYPQHRSSPARARVSPGLWREKRAPGLVALRPPKPQGLLLALEYHARDRQGRWTQVERGRGAHKLHDAVGSASADGAEEATALVPT